jgi:hypothetical protein
MSAAFVLGNGVSRLSVDLNQLKPHGQIYGCNALYREFVPDVLISTDKAIAHTIQNSGYAEKHLMYTRKPLPGLGARSVPQSIFWVQFRTNCCGSSSNRPAFGSVSHWI